MSEKSPLDKAKELYPEWHMQHARVVRCEGLDSAINREFAPLSDEMDKILDDYNDLQKATLGGVVLKAAAATL